MTPMMPSFTIASSVLSEPIHFAISILYGQHASASTSSLPCPASSTRLDLKMFLNNTFLLWESESSIPFMTSFHFLLNSDWVLMPLLQLGSIVS